VNYLKVPLTLFAAAALALPAAAQVPSLDARVSLNVVEQDLSQVVQYLRDRSGANIVVLKGGQNKVRDLQINDVYWRDALEYAVELAGCVLAEDKSGVLAITDPEKVNFEFDDMDTDINQIITTIAKVSGANIVVSPDVTGTLRVRLHDVPWRVALEEIAKTRGYTVVEEQRGILRVVDPLSLEKQKVTRSYQLRYVRPRSSRVPRINSEFIDGQSKPPTGTVAEHFTVLEAMRKALSSEGQLDFIEDQNVIILRDTTQVHETVQEILRRLDVEPAQVFVDIKFVSTANTDLLDLGVDYGDSGPLISVSGSQIPIELPFDIGRGGFEDGFIANQGNQGPYSNVNQSDSGIIIPDTIFGALSFTQVQATLRMLQRDTRSDVIQAPKIITLDGNEATIFVGETVRYAEAKSEQGQAGGLSLSVQEAQNSPVEVGFQLLVRPHVIPGTKKVMMEVIPKETSLTGASTNSALAPPGFDIFTIGAVGLEGSIALPRTRSSTLMTEMMLESGQTAVIGGLTTDVETKIKTQVPYLGSIPILGELFKHRSETRERRSLIIFITPTLVHSAEDTEFLLQQELQRRHTRIKDEIEALVNPDMAGQ
jgi:type IV pilus assembly protein PilQ